MPEIMTYLEQNRTEWNGLISQFEQAESNSGPRNPYKRSRAAKQSAQTGSGSIHLRATNVGLLSVNSMQNS